MASLFQQPKFKPAQVVSAFPQGSTAANSVSGQHLIGKEVLPLIRLQQQQQNGDTNSMQVMQALKPKTQLDKFKEQYLKTPEKGNNLNARRGSHQVPSSTNYVNGNQKGQINSSYYSNNHQQSLQIPNSSSTRARSQSFNGINEDLQTKYILDLSKPDDQIALQNTLKMKNQISEFQLDMIKRTFAPLKIFVDLERQMKREEYTHLLQNMNFLKLQKGEVVFEYGDLGEKYFIILKGSVYVLLKTNYGETVRKMKVPENENSSAAKRGVCKSEPATPATVSEYAQEGFISYAPKKKTTNLFSENNQYDTSHTLSRKNRGGTFEFEVDSEPDYEAKGSALKNEIKQKYPQFTIVANHFEGEGFGEYSLIKNIRRTATIITSQETIFATVDKNEYNEILKDHIEAIFQKKIQFLKSFKIFESLEKKLSNLVMCFQSIFYQRGDIIFNESDDSHSLYFIQSGEVEISCYESNLDHKKQISSLQKQSDHSNKNGPSQKQQFNPQKFQEQEEDREEDGDAEQLRRLLLNSSQKYKRVKKRVILAILNDKSYFGEEEVILKSRKRKTQAKVLSAEFSGLKISLKNFLILCKFTDVMKRLHLNYKVKQQWRDAYHTNCNDVKEMFNSPNYSSSISPSKQNDSNNNNSDKLNETTVSKNSPQLNNSGCYSNFKTGGNSAQNSPNSQSQNAASLLANNKNNNNSAAGSPTMRQSRFAQYPSDQQAQENIKQTSSFLQQNEKDGSQPNEIKMLLSLSSLYTKQHSMQLQQQKRQQQQQQQQQQEQQQQSQQLQIVVLNKSDQFEKQTTNNLINLSSLVGGTKETSKKQFISSSPTTCSGQLHFSSSLSPIMRHKNLSNMEENLITLDQTDFNKSVQQQQSTCLIPLALGKLSANGSNHSKKLSQQNNNSNNNHLSSQNKSPTSVLSSYDSYQRNFKLNLNQLGDSREVTPRNHTNNYQNQDDLNLVKINLNTTVDQESFANVARLKSEGIYKEDENRNIVNQENSKQEHLKTNVSQLEQSFYSNCYYHQSTTKTPQSKSRKSNSPLKRRNVSKTEHSHHEDDIETHRNEVQNHVRLSSHSSNQKRGSQAGDASDIINQGYTYYKSAQQNKEVGTRNSMLEHLSYKDFINENSMLQEYTQQFNQESQDAKYGYVLQKNSHLVFNYQKIHQILCVNENLIKQNEKGKRMLRYYNDIQKTQPQGFKKFISPFMFYKEKNNEASIFQNAYMKIDNSTNTPAPQQFEVQNVYGSIRKRSLDNSSYNNSLIGTARNLSQDQKLSSRLPSFNLHRQPQQNNQSILNNSGIGFSRNQELNLVRKKFVKLQKGVKGEGRRVSGDGEDTHDTNSNFNMSISPTKINQQQKIKQFKRSTSTAMSGQ